eukprot:6484453-Amphidinium_carterae.1
MERVGTIMVFLDKESNKGKLRDGVRQPLKELRSKRGTTAESNLFPECVVKKLHAITNMSS